MTNASTPQPITLHFVRHGETPFNAERRYQTPDVPLSDLGREQAAAVAETLAASTHSSLILASDYERTQETARIIAARLELPIVLDEALRERNFGIARGQLYTDIAEETRALWREPRHRIEQGESWADVFERIAAFFVRMREEPPASDIICVTHGGAMSVALQHLAGTSIDDFEVATLENCALRTVVLAHN